jgi:hypothetical protein
MRIRWSKVSAWSYDADADKHRGVILDLFVDGMPPLRLREAGEQTLHWLNWALSEQDRPKEAKP